MALSPCLLPAHPLVCRSQRWGLESVKSQCFCFNKGKVVLFDELSLDLHRGLIHRFASQAMGIKNVLLVGQVNGFFGIASRWCEFKGWSCREGLNQQSLHWLAWLLSGAWVLV